MLLADKICVKTGVASRCGIGWATVALFAVSRIHFGDGIKPIVGYILALIAESTRNRGAAQAVAARGRG
jgi:hypothetical protein